MQKILILDVESTTKQKGHPFHKDNKLCLVGVFDGTTYTEYDIEYTDSPYGSDLSKLQQQLEEAEVIIGFNIKFDLHWIRRYIPHVTINRVWDCQLAEFILGHQKSPYPSLDKSCIKRGLVGKFSDAVHALWADGFDTPSIDRTVLSEYLQQDCKSTYDLYVAQQEVIPDNLKSLIKLHNSDLLVLQEMEFNGMPFDNSKCKELNEHYLQELQSVNDLLKHWYPHPSFNPNSNHHLSVLLFGGNLEYDCQVPTARTLKSGAIKTGSKKGTNFLPIKGLFKPDKKWEYKATRNLKDFELELTNQRRLTDGKQLLQRIYSTDSESMQALKSRAKSKEAKDLIDLLMRRAYLEKLQSTYFGGYPKLVEQYGWQQGTMHGQFNQCVAVTGRLSSSNPNLQNIAKEVKQIFRSEYE